MLGFDCGGKLCNVVYPTIFFAFESVEPLFGKPGNGVYPLLVQIRAGSDYNYPRLRVCVANAGHKRQGFKRFPHTNFVRQKNTGFPISMSSAPRTVSSWRDTSLSESPSALASAPRFTMLWSHSRVRVEITISLYNRRIALGRRLTENDLEEGPVFQSPVASHLLQRRVISVSLPKLDRRQRKCWPMFGEAQAIEPYFVRIRFAHVPRTAEGASRLYEDTCGTIQNHAETSKRKKGIRGYRGGRAEPGTKDVRRLKLLRRRSPTRPHRWTRLGRPVDVNIRFAQC